MTYYGIPHYSAAFETGTGTKTVAGTFDLIFQGNGRVRVTTDRGEVRCKGKEWNVHADFVRQADGTFKDSIYSLPTVRNRRDFSDPTGAVRKLISEAAREFAATHYTEVQDAAADLAIAESRVQLAQSDVEYAEGKLVEAKDWHDEAIRDRDAAVIRAAALGINPENERTA